MPRLERVKNSERVVTDSFVNVGRLSYPSCPIFIELPNE